MTVPKSKRSIPKSGYVINAGIVLDSTKRLMRKWPKSRNYIEVIPTINLIFEEAGLSRKIIGSKRIERASARWREAEFKGILGDVHHPQVRHENKIEKLKEEKSQAVKKQREIRNREVNKLNEKIDRLKKRVQARDEMIDTY